MKFIKKVDRETIVIVSLLITLISITIAVFRFANIDFNNKQLKQINPEFMREYIDEETGVHYLMYVYRNSVNISVRYNADGTIMTDQNKE